MSSTQIKDKVTTTYFSCKEYLRSQTTDDKLVEKARSYVLDVDKVLQHVNDSNKLTDIELADLYVLHGLYPPEIYFYDCKS